MIVEDLKEIVRCAMLSGLIRLPPTIEVIAEAKRKSHLDYMREYMRRKRLRLGMKPMIGPKPTPEQLRLQKSMCMARLRAERKGQDTSAFPPRLRKRNTT